MVQIKQEEHGGEENRGEDDEEAEARWTGCVHHDQDQDQDRARESGEAELKRRTFLTPILQVQRTKTC